MQKADTKLRIGFCLSMHAGLIGLRSHLDMDLLSAVRALDHRSLRDCSRHLIDEEVTHLASDDFGDSP